MINQNDNLMFHNHEKSFPVKREYVIFIFNVRSCKLITLLTVTYFISHFTMVANDVKHNHCTTSNRTISSSRDQVEIVALLLVEVIQLLSLALVRL